MLDNSILYDPFYFTILFFYRSGILSRAGQYRDLNSISFQPFVKKQLFLYTKYIKSDHDRRENRARYSRPRQRNRFPFRTVADCRARISSVRRANPNDSSIGRAQAASSLARALFARTESIVSRGVAQS